MTRITQHSSVVGQAVLLTTYKVLLHIVPTDSPVFKFLSLPCANSFVAATFVPPLLCLAARFLSFLCLLYFHQLICCIWSICSRVCHHLSLHPSFCRALVSDQVLVNKHSHFLFQNNNTCLFLRLQIPPTIAQHSDLLSACSSPPLSESSLGILIGLTDRLRCPSLHHGLSSRVSAVSRCSQSLPPG